MATVKKPLRYPCIFRHPMIKSDVNPRLAAVAKTVPFGAFQRIWRQEHCRGVNPYGSEDCPYRPEDCVLAYWKTANDALTTANTSPIGLFKVLARRRGYDRADNKPLARDRDEATGGHPGTRPEGDSTRQGLHRIGSGPVRIGDVLRTMDFGARQRPKHEGEESP